jgi:hypothetical protein
MAFDANRVPTRLRARLLLAAVLAACSGVCLVASADQSGARNGSGLADWLAHDDRGVRYVGTAECARCHEAQATAQVETPMAHALQPAASCEVLTTRQRLTVRNGRYTYRITRQGDRSVYTVTDGTRSISEPVLYAFGQGVIGQTYLLQHDGKLYETRVSYFRRLENLDITIGQPREAPVSLEDAVGRPVGADEARSCFGCHTPTAVSGTTLRMDRITSGITCEACHGPGAAHVAAVQTKTSTDPAQTPADPRVFNPGRLGASELTEEFCGSCHLSFEQAMLLPGQGGVNNVRFQAYRLFNSKGHRGADPRISCIACHDPHKRLDRDPASYDAKCLACHLGAPQEAKTETRKASACSVSATRCVTCHMPKVELPGMHGEFTDHWIRVAKAGDPVPN